MLKCVVSASAGLGAGGVKGTAGMDKGCFFIRFCSRSACCRWAVAVFFFSRLSNFSAASTLSRFSSNSNTSVPCFSAKIHGLGRLCRSSAVLIFRFEARVVSVASGRITAEVTGLGE